MLIAALPPFVATSGYLGVQVIHGPGNEVLLLVVFSNGVNKPNSRRCFRYFQRLGAPQQESDQSCEEG